MDWWLIAGGVVVLVLILGLIVGGGEEKESKSDSEGTIEDAKNKPRRAPASKDGEVGDGDDNEELKKPWKEIAGEEAAVVKQEVQQAKKK